VVAAPAAVAVGAPLVRLRYGVVDFAGAPLTTTTRCTTSPRGHRCSSVGPLQIAATLLLPASTAALVYALLAAAATRDDLGG
jgi:hypothetical protein